MIAIICVFFENTTSLVVTVRDQLDSFSSIDRNSPKDKPNTDREHALPMSDNFVAHFNDKQDSEIWSAFRSNHEGAFAFIYDCYFDTLFNYGCQLTSDTCLVEDLLQDFFLELRLKRQRLSDIDNIKAYLLKSFRRKVFKQLKKVKHLVLDNNPPEGSFDITFYQDIQFINTQFHKVQQEKISQMLKKLTPREKEAIYYFFYENLDYKGVAQIMGLSSSKTARNLIYKALSGLKKKKHQFPDWLRSFTLLLL